MDNKLLPIGEKLEAIVFDFDGIFTTNQVYVDSNGVESVSCSRSDSLALELYRKHLVRRDLQTKLIVLSRESNPVVVKRCDKLKLACVSNTKDKLSYLKSRYQVSQDGFINNIMYLGNDLNDYKSMVACQWSASPSDANEAIKAISRYVSPSQGGRGFIADVLYQLIGDIEYTLSLL